MTRPIIALLVSAFLLVGCGKEESGTAQAPSATSHEAQGEALTTDPGFVINLKIGDTDAKFVARQLAIFESKPAQGDKAERPQGFELAADENCTLAGRLPADTPFAPSQKYEKLVGAELTIAARGGDPSAPARSKIQTPQGKTYLATGGTIKINRAFHKTGEYAGVSGTIDVKLQEIKLGNPEDPNNKGDQPVGEPITATGTFTSRVASYPYEQL